MMSTLLHDVEDRVAAREMVLTEVRRVLIELFTLPRELDEIDPDTPLFGTGLGLDSIDAVELVVALESEFGVRLANDALARTELRTVNTLVELILSMRATDVHD
jgi:acyl carrier protein